MPSSIQSVRRAIVNARMIGTNRRQHDWNTPYDMTALALALLALAVLLAAWLVVRAALRGLRTFVRSLWPH